VLNTRRLRFTPRPFATFATLVAALAFAALGQWQLNRAAEKRALAEDFAGAGPAVALRADNRQLPRYQRVTARGRYDSARQFLLDNRVQGGRAGVEVLTPLLLDAGGAVLVNRGWQPFGATREVLPDVAVAAETRTIAGRLDELPRPGIALEAPPSAGWPRLVSYPTADQLATMFGRAIEPRIILLDADEPDGYVRDWRLPGTTPGRHLGYALQWFAFAATAVAIWLALSLRRDGEDA
jgi:cytochrome oxidase assembly protein ShyY1